MNLEQLTERMFEIQDILVEIESKALALPTKDFDHILDKVDGIRNNYCIPKDLREKIGGDCSKQEIFKAWVIVYQRDLREKLKE